MKKINIGIILIILTLIGMIFYLIYEENIKAKDRQNIVSFLNEYYKVYNKYCLLYEEDRYINKIIDKSKYDKYKEEIRQELDKYLTTDENLRQKIYNDYDLRLDEQIKGKYIYNTYNMTLAIEKNEYNQMRFCNNYIFVMQKIKLEVNRVSRINDIYNKETLKYEGSVRSEVGTDYVYEYFIITKINGEYRIVVHSMCKPISFSFDEEIRDISVW